MNVIDSNHYELNVRCVSVSERIHVRVCLCIYASSDAMHATQQHIQQSYLISSYAIECGGAECRKANRSIEIIFVDWSNQLALATDTAILNPNKCNFDCG